MSNILKFSYFLVLILLVSCGETTSKKIDGDAAEVEVTKSDIVPEGATKVILFFGNSLTAGYGLDPEEAFPAVIQAQLDSLELQYTVVNAGLSGETTASGRNRLSWVLNQKADIFVLELGANDGLRGIPLEETRKNLETIVNAVRERNPETEIILAGMQIPPNMGPEYTSEFRRIFPDLAEEQDLYLIPFLLEGVAGIPELNQTDGIHPTIEGHRILANNVWEVLEDIVQ
ncbi:MAG TPA: arylesterase [Eudoraea sp.]|nr:arylesterase [Eudoraea sp.]